MIEVIDHGEGIYLWDTDGNRYIGENPQAKFSPSGVLSFPLRETGAAVIDGIEEVLGRIASSPES